MHINPNGPILPLVLAAGLFDSLNPCAIAILLIFIALMFTLKRARLAVIGMGVVYISAVLVSYFAIGLGILKIVNLFGIPHILSYVGAWVVIVIGMIGLAEFFFPSKIRILSIPLKPRQIIAHWATKATIPAAAISGLLVGIFEFPCSGAIYLAVIGLLNAKETFIKGIAYLILYNLMFILPLIVILIITSNRAVTERLINADEQNSGKIRLISALIMIAIGASILIWFV